MLPRKLTNCGITKSRISYCLFFITHEEEVINRKLRGWLGAAAALYTFVSKEDKKETRTIPLEDIATATGGGATYTPISLN